MLKLRMMWGNLHSSLWFLPGLIVMVAVALALCLIQVDSALGSDNGFYERWPLLMGSGAEGARGLLTTVASSMITVAGVVFSITIVALSLASNQYTSRVLRNFMRDRVNQSVLGLFVGIFAYCLVVLRTIRGGEELVFVPSLAVLVGLLLAFLGIAVFIYFIHHISVSIQAVTILAEVAEETLVAVDRQYPDTLGAVGEAGPVTLGSKAGWRPVNASSDGYVQSFDSSTLLNYAAEHQAVIHAVSSVGDFAVGGTPLVYVKGNAVDDELLQKFAACYAIGRQRTVEQDLGFGIRQIVDVALKALSPGINDTTTAVMCINYLTTILHRVTQRSISCQYQASDGVVRLFTCGPTYASFLSGSFDQIRQNAAANVAILECLLQSLAMLLSEAPTRVRREQLYGHVTLVGELARRSIEQPADRQCIDELANELKDRYADGPGS